MADLTKTIKIEVDESGAITSITNLNKSLQENTKETAAATDKAKKYNKQLQDKQAITGQVTKALDNMTGGLYSQAKGVMQSMKAFKAFNLVLKLSPLFLIVGVVASIITAFKRLDGPMRMISELFGGLDGILNVLLDRIAKFGEALIAIFTGRWSDGLRMFKESWQGVGDAMQKAYDLGVLIERESTKFSVNESARLVQIARKRREIELLTRQSRERDTRSAQDRLNIVEQATQKEREIVELQKQNAEERMRIDNMIFQNSTQNDKDKIAFNQALQRHTEKITAAETKLRELENRRQETITQINAENRKTETSLANQLVQKTEIAEQAERIRNADSSINENQILQEIFNDELQDQIDLESKLSTIEQMRMQNLNASSQEEINTQQNLNSRLQQTSQAALSLLDIFKGKQKGKSIFKGVLGVVGNLLTMFTGNPLFSIGSSFLGGLFANGGVIPEGFPNDSYPALLTSNEGVINARSMSIPWVREMASQLNQIGGGVKFADGGVMNPSTSNVQLDAINRTLQTRQYVLSIPDLITNMNKISTVQNRSKL